MINDYTNKTLIEIEKEINRKEKKVVLTGKSLTLQDIFSSASGAKVLLTKEKAVIDKIEKSHDAMIKNVLKGIPIYGTNSSFGGQAKRVFNQGDEAQKIEYGKLISESLIFLDVGVGPLVPTEITRAAIAIRVNMLMQGVSGVRISTLEKILQLLNKNLIPVVNSYGGIGASGDLTHNQRVVGVLRGIAGSKVINEKGKIEEAKSALARNDISALELEPKEGLALVNGDNFSTAYAALVVKKLIEYFLIGEIVSAMAIEVLRGTNRSFHPLLSKVRPHKGQIESSDNYRYLLKGSKLAYQELGGHKPRPKGVKIQDGYSVRCLSQFEGPMIEKIKFALNTIEINANSVSDNPLWVPEDSVTEGEEPWQWVSGGNFLAMHMVEVLDSMRKITTQLIKRNDRHLARMIDETENNGLPANLSGKRSVDHCTFKGVQIQSGMLEIYSMVLANPVSTLFGVHEERNQDITTHAITSGILSLQNLELLKYSLASNLLAVAQGVDLRGGSKLLSPKTRPMYDFVRTYSKYANKNRPFSEDIENLASLLDSGDITSLVREKIFA